MRSARSQSPIGDVARWLFPPRKADWLGIAGAVHRYMKARDVPAMHLSSLVYVVWGPVSCVIKIGYTERFRQRLRELRAGSPEPLLPLVLIEGSAEDESRLHVRLCDDRIHSEWFAAGHAAVSLVEEMCAEPGAVVFPHVQHFRRKHGPL